MRPNEPCQFCEIGAGDVDQDLVVLRTGDVFVIPTLKQRAANHGQVIVLPVAHVTALHEAGPALRADVFDVVATLTAAMPGAFGATGSTVFQSTMFQSPEFQNTAFQNTAFQNSAFEGAAVQNNDPLAQELSHLHIHVVPRFTGDGFSLPDPGIQTAPRSLRAELATRLRWALAH